MNTFARVAVLSSIFLFLVLRPAVADDAEDLYKSVYEPKVKQALATVDRKDDATLAAEFLVAAKQQTDLPRLAIMLADKAYELTARDPAGLALAGDALTMLVELDKKRRVELQDKLIDIRQRQFTAARADGKAPAADALIDSLLLSAKPKVEAKEFAAALPLYRRALSAAILGKSERQAELKASVDGLQRQQKAMDQINLLREKLLANANDFGAIDELVKLFIIDFDDANEALTYANRSKDPALKEFASLAAKEATELTPEQNLKLGDWYRTLASSVADERKATPLLRAKESYQAATESPTTTDVNRRKAELLGKEVDASLKKLGIGVEVKPRESKAVEGQWFDMIPLIDISKEIPNTKLSINRKGELIHQGQEGRETWIRLPGQVTGPYEWRIKFEHTTGGGYRFIFPINANNQNKGCLFAVGSTIFIESGQVDSREAANRSEVGIEKGKTYVFHIIVRPDTEKVALTLKVDNKVRIQTAIETAKFGHSEGFVLNPGTGQTIFHEVKVRALPGGELKLPASLKGIQQ